MKLINRLNCCWYIFLLISFVNLLASKPFPVSFSISENKIVNKIPDKTRDFAFIVPGDFSTYIYESEEEYYKDYQRSFYAITRKKAGWDCLRHYEILANGCIPYFIDIDNCPSNTMHLFPKELIKEAMHLPGVSLGRIDHALFDKKRYYCLLNQLLEHTRKYLTTRSLADYVLDAIGYSGKGKILFLSTNANPDYLRTTMFIGFRQVLGDRVVDYPKLDHVYTNYSFDAKLLYGKGFSYTKIIEDIPVDRSNIEQRIRDKEFEFIVYPHVHWGRPLYDVVQQNYPPEKIAYLDGEDEHFSCPFIHLKNFFLREYK